MPADHRAFVRLFPELGVDDPILEPERFERELLPTTNARDHRESLRTATAVPATRYFFLVKRAMEAFPSIGRERVGFPGPAPRIPPSEVPAPPQRDRRGRRYGSQRRVREIGTDGPRRWPERATETPIR